MRRITPLIAAVLIASLGAVVACSTVPQSEELQELEEKLRDPESQQLRELPNAARYHSEARQYRRVAEEAREDRRQERSKEYARLGLLRYRTAVAIYEKFETVDDLHEVNAEIEEINPKLRETMNARNEMVAELRELDDEIRDAVQEREQLRLAQARQGDDFDAASGDDAGTADAQLLEEANEIIAEAEQLREASLEYNADEYRETRILFDRADTQLDRAREMIQDRPSAVSTAKRQLGFAVQLFEEAHEQAQPIHAEYVEMMRPENRISAIRDIARDNFGRQYSEQENGGVRIIMARLFEAGEDEFRRETGPMLDALADIAEEYEEFTVNIEGHTQRQGGATEARALSQQRAQLVEGELVDAGIDEARISRDGYGHDNVRFSDSPANNDRVEVVLRHEDR